MYFILAKMIDLWRRLHKIKTGLLYEPLLQ